VVAAGPAGAERPIGVFDSGVGGLTVVRAIEELLPHCADPSVALAAATGAVAMSSLSGDFERGDRIARATELYAEQEVASPSESAWWFFQVGSLKFLEARYEEALDYFRRGSQVAETNGLRAALPQVAGPAACRRFPQRGQRRPGRDEGRGFHRAPLAVRVRLTAAMDPLC